MLCACKIIGVKEVGVIVDYQADFLLYLLFINQLSNFI